ncbi:MAG: NTP transferase domain-containing protein, partial [Paracoccaceae bacterium]
MGGIDKALLPLMGRPLVDHVLTRLAPQLGPIAISANGNPARFEPWGLPVLRDGFMGEGPLAGLMAGLGWAEAQGAKALVTVAVDTPFVPADLVARLAGRG